MVSVLSGVNVFLNPQQRAASHQKAGTAYNSLKNDVRMFRTVHASFEQADGSLVAKLESLSKSRNDLNKQSPALARRFFERARVGIEEGEAVYRVTRNRARAGRR